MALHWDTELSVDERADLGDRRFHERREQNLADELAPRRARRDEGDSFAAFMYGTAVALTRASGLRLVPDSEPPPSSEPWCPAPGAA